MEHLTQEKALEYISGKLDEEQLFEIDEHLATCTRCVARVRALRMLRANFDEIWDSLSVENLARDALETRLLESLMQSDVKQEILQRAQSWVKSFYQTSQMVIGLAVDISKKTVSILQDVTEEMSTWGQIPRYVPVGQPVRVLGEGADEDTLEERRSPSGEKIDIYYTDGTVQLKITPLSFESPPPLLWLLPKSGGPSIIIETQHPIETEYLVAEFSIEELADLNDYIIFLEYKEMG